MAWLARYERFTLHFTPTSCSWLDAVESFFAKLAKQRNRAAIAALLVHDSSCQFYS